jgi:molybdopterin-dependent oxidoreductase alpha subunit
MRKLKSGGGWPAIFYTLRKAWEVSGWFRPWAMWSAMRSRNACKTCALGMGGQRGGMVNELGSFPEVCKKSLQAMASDMQGAIKPQFWSTYSIPQLRSFSPRELETCGRLVQPVLLERGQQYYRPIEWSEALSRIVAKLKSLAPDETFWYFSGRSSNEAGFLLQLFARIYGTNNVNNCSYYCHQASGVGLASSVGSGTATVMLEDVERADLVFVIGGNPASNHPRLMTSLAHVRRRGGKVVAINPVIETGLVNFRIPSQPLSLLWGTQIASDYIQPHIGGDLALLTGIAKRVDEMGAQNAEFLKNYCEGSQEYLRHLRETPWPEIVRRSGVSLDQINRLAETYAQAQHVVFSWTMGITHHAHGVENVQAIANLAMLRGMLGRPQAGLLPIRGHSNVQGIGSMGVTPKLKDVVFQRLEEHFLVNLPRGAGLDTLACMEAAAAGQLKFGLCLGGNLYGSNPDARFADQALAQIEMLVMLNTTLNTGHAHGLASETIILPVLARDEEPEPTTQESMFNYVRLSDGGPRRHAGPRSEVEVIAELADAVLASDGAINWREMQHTKTIRQTIAKIVPGFEALEQIDQTKQEFQIPGRTFHTPKFPTPSGRAILHCHELPPLKGEGEELRLMTVRSEGQFNTVVYEDYDLYRGQERRDVILLHPDDMQRLHLAHDELVTVHSDTGSLAKIRARAFAEIRAGNALMYYPEANVLVSRTSDPKSKTPAFKGVVVRLEKTAPVGVAPSH